MREETVSESRAQLAKREQQEAARASLRSHSFYEPVDLTIYQTATGPGDDGRSRLPLSETLVASLLVNSSPAVYRKVFGHQKPILCVCNARQPVATTVWPDAQGHMRVYIMDGRQRAGESEQRGKENPGAIEAINIRVRQVVALAADLVAADSELVSDSHKLRVRLRTKCKELHATDPAWAWANANLLPLYIGGKLGDASSNLDAPGMIDWSPCEKGQLPAAIPYVAWVAHEPEDRDPATCVTQLASLGLKSAQVAYPPTEEARQVANLCKPVAPPRLDGESEADYEARIAPGGPYGQGLPITVVAVMMGVTVNTIQDRMHILQLEPEVQQAIDAHVRGEPGLSLRQVRDGGFYLAGTGGRNGGRIAKSREDQLKLLELLMGRRGLSAVAGSDSDSDSGSGSGSGSGSRESVNDRREISIEDSAGDRHAASEPRAQVGPDSPTTQKHVRADVEFFRAMRDRIQVSISEIPTAADGTIKTDAGRAQFMQLDAVYHALALLSGDPTAFARDSRNASVNEFREKCGDAMHAVLRALGLTIKHGVGLVSTGAAVVAANKRAPAEMSVTPRDVAPVAAPPAVAPKSVFGDKPTEDQSEPVATAPATATAPTSAHAAAPPKAKKAAKPAPSGKPAAGKPAPSKAKKAARRGPQTAKKKKKAS